MISAKVIEDSLAPNGVRLTTLELQYPRFIHSEVMTHRVFSRNAMSSRAVPVAKMIAQVRHNPAMPCHWGKNQPGMQAAEEHNELVRVYFPDGSDAEVGVMAAWEVAAAHAANIAEAMSEAGYHKQVVNRILEPFQWMHTIVTATEWDNFFELRLHPDAEPNFFALAHEMMHAMFQSRPVERPSRGHGLKAWHLPYVTAEERDSFYIDTLVEISAARCARVSYLNHDGTSPSLDKDKELYHRLVGSKPLHASPIEHQAYPLPLASQWSRNFRGWRQNRELVEFQLQQEEMTRQFHQEQSTSKV
jgi:thymidylate synthase ThyX